MAAVHKTLKKIHSLHTPKHTHAHTYTHTHNASSFSRLTIKTGMISVWGKNCQCGCSLGDLMGGEEEEEEEGCEENIETRRWKGK